MKISTRETFRQLLLTSGSGDWLQVCSRPGSLIFLRWLPRVSTKVTIRSGKICKRSPSSVVLQSFFLNFTRKVTNIITLFFRFCFLRIGLCHGNKASKEWQIFSINSPFLLNILIFLRWTEIFLNFHILWKWFWLTVCRGKNMRSFRRIHRYHVISYF